MKLYILLIIVIILFCPENMDFEIFNLAEALAENTPPAKLLISKFYIPPRRRLEVPSQIKNIVI